jgi:hypothetical protein
MNHENVLGKLKCCKNEGGGNVIMYEYIATVVCDEAADIV